MSINFLARYWCNSKPNGKIIIIFLVPVKTGNRESVQCQKNLKLLSNFVWLLSLFAQVSISNSAFMWITWTNTAENAADPMSL